MPARLLTMPAAPASISTRAGLLLALADMRGAVDMCDKPADALALWRWLHAIVGELDALADQAARKCDALGVDWNVDRPMLWGPEGDA